MKERECQKMVEYVPVRISPEVVRKTVLQTVQVVTDFVTVTFTLITHSTDQNLNTVVVFSNYVLSHVCNKFHAFLGGNPTNKSKKRDGRVALLKVKVPLLNLSLGLSVASYTQRLK